MKINKLILTILLTSSSLSLFGCFKSSPTQVSEKFIRLMNERKIDEAMTLLSSNAEGLLDEEQTNPNLEREIKKDSALYQGAKILQRVDKIVSFQVNSQVISGNCVRVYYTLKYDDKTQQTGVFKLTRENQEWKINTGQITSNQT